MKQTLFVALLTLTLPMTLLSEVTNAPRPGCYRDCQGCTSSHGICECPDKSLCSEGCTCRSLEQETATNNE